MKTEHATSPFARGQDGCFWPLRYKITAMLVATCKKNSIVGQEYLKLMDELQEDLNRLKNCKSNVNGFGA